MQIQITLLGGFEVWVGDQPVRRFESFKARGLLSYLALTYPRGHTRESLAGLFWPDLSERRARHNLSQTIYTLRQSMASAAAPTWLRTDNLRIGIAADAPICIDVADFEAALRGCGDHVPQPDTTCPGCLGSAAEAVALYQGELMAGHSFPGCREFETWLVRRREALHRRVLGTLHTVADWQRELGHSERAVTFARRAVTLDPLWEPAWRQLIRTLWLAGRRPEALAEVEACRLHLERELGLPLEPETLALAQLVRDAAPDRAAVTSIRQSLPHFLTPFIGRDAEVSRLTACLRGENCRLVTLVGPGGSGKTRIAVEVARRMAANYRDGVCFVALSGLQAPEALPYLLADTLGLVVEDARTIDVQLVDFLRDKELLLLLDSFERLLDGVSTVVTLLHEAPTLKVLATSRVRLGVSGEQLVPIDGLPLAPPQGRAAIASDAELLFLAAARRLRPDYEPVPEDTPHIRAICRETGGNPLGIILAAAWMQLLEPQQIAARIARSLNFLSADWPDLPARQRSMRATLDYSWNLLDADLQALFARLAVFAGGFSLEAGLAVGLARAQDLRRLADLSLLQLVAGDRYQIHDLLREYAADKLPALPEGPAAARERQARFFLSRLAAARNSLLGAEQTRTLNWLDQESANVAVAWAWAVKAERRVLLAKALDGLGHYSDVRGHLAEGYAACGAAAGVLAPRGGFENRPVAGLAAQIWQARFARRLGRQEEATLLCQDALAWLEENDPAAEAQSVRAFLFFELGNLGQHTARDEAGKWYERSLTGYRELADEWGCAQVLNKLGMIAHHYGEYDRALALHEESRRYFAALGNRRGLATALLELGHNAMRLHRLVEGEAFIRASIEQFVALGDRVSAARAQMNLVRLNYWLGKLPEMIPLLRQCVPALLQVGLLSDAAFAQSGFPLIYAHLGEYEAALDSGAETLALTRRAGVARTEALATAGLGAAALASGDLPQAELYLAQCVTLSREIEQMEELATGLSLQGCLAVQTGALASARDVLHEALQICLATRSMWSVFHTLPFVALYLAAEEAPEAALETFALVTRYPPAAIPLNEALAGQPIAALAAALPAGAAEAARQRGLDADLWERIAALETRLAT